MDAAGVSELETVGYRCQVGNSLHPTEGVLERDVIEGAADGVAVVTSVEDEIMESLYGVPLKGGGVLIGY